MRHSNEVLKALADTSWGMYEEIIVEPYEEIGSLLLNYAVPVWISFPSDPTSPI